MWNDMWMHGLNDVFEWRVCMMFEWGLNDGDVSIENYSKQPRDRNSPSWKVPTKAVSPSGKTYLESGYDLTWISSYNLTDCWSLNPFGLLKHFNEPKNPSSQPSSKPGDMRLSPECSPQPSTSPMTPAVMFGFLKATSNSNRESIRPVQRGENWWIKQIKSRIASRNHVIKSCQ